MEIHFCYLLAAIALCYTIKVSSTTPAPTRTPSLKPTSCKPSKEPTRSPSKLPSKLPTSNPSKISSAIPLKSTISPSSNPPSSRSPTIISSKSTTAPTLKLTTIVPWKNSGSPTITPTKTPSPTIKSITSVPTIKETTRPSIKPTLSLFPSAVPSATKLPTTQTISSSRPSAIISVSPSVKSTVQPSTLSTPFRSSGPSTKIPTSKPSISAAPLRSAFPSSRRPTIISKIQQIEVDLSTTLPKAVVHTIQTYVKNGTLRIATLLSANVEQRAVNLFSTSSHSSLLEKQVIALRDSSMRCAECAQLVAYGNSSVVNHLLATSRYAVVSSDAIAWAYMNYSSFSTSTNSSTLNRVRPMLQWSNSCDTVLLEALNLARIPVSYLISEALSEQSAPTPAATFSPSGPSFIPTIAPTSRIISGGDGCGKGAYKCDAAGYYCVLSNSTCYECPANQFCPNEKGSYAYYCPAGQVSDPGSSSCHDVIPNIPSRSPTAAPTIGIIAGGDGCNNGAYSCDTVGTYCVFSLSTCLQCPANQFCPNLKGSYAYYCPVGQVSSPGSSSCSKALTKLNYQQSEPEFPNRTYISHKLANLIPFNDVRPAAAAPRGSMFQLPNEHSLQNIELMEQFDTSGKRYRIYNPDCFDSDIDVFFINGILNSKVEAAASANKLQTVVNEVLADKFDIKSTVYSIYNPSEGPVVDLLECVDLVAQQAFNIGPGNVFRFLAALAMLVAAPEVSVFAAMEAIYPFWIRTVTKWVTDHNQANNEQIIADAKSKIDESISKGRKVFLVAHSQGNLYMNTIYQALDQEDRYYVKLLSVATPAPYVGLPGVNYPYVSRKDDKVVVLTIGDLPPSPVVPSHTDGKFGISLFGLNHGFDDMYLGDAAVGALVRSYILAQVTLMLAPYDEGPHNKVRGSVIASVTGYPKIKYPQSAWDIDIDLHVYEPTGSHIYYKNQYGGNTDGSLGYLNADVNGYAYTELGVDYYYIEKYSICAKYNCPTGAGADCRSKVPNTGTYYIAVNYFACPADYYTPINHDPDHKIDDDHHDNRKDWDFTASVDVLLLAGPKRLQFTINLPAPVGPAGDFTPKYIAAIDVTKVNGKPRYSLRRL
mmetsp:Transcript_3134/g.4337  ORF Transcript_3134/g.4337 Transcript_3134/m.4337 type:complete len:1100 (-) Transcript_3134:1222-4521(-)